MQAGFSRVAGQAALLLLVAGCSVGNTSNTVVGVSVAAPQPAVTVATWRAEGGDDRAAMQLAQANFRAGNTVAAFRWAKLAADRGDGTGQAAVSRAYTLGLGVPQNYELALRYARLSADQKNPSGENNLAVLTEQGRGAPADPAAAVRLYRLSAEAGNVFAAKSLASCLERGLGVAQDRRLAYFWYSIAAAKLSGPALAFAVEHREDIAKTLPAGEVAKYQALATAWQPYDAPPSS